MVKEELIDKIEILIASRVFLDSNRVIHIEGLTEEIFDVAEDYFLSLPEYSDGYVD